MLKENDRLKFSQDVALDHVIGKGKIWWKLSYKLLKEYYVYDPFFYISTYPTLIQLKHFLGGIHHCVTFVGKWIFDINFPFTLTLTEENLDYCWINDNEKKGMNGYKRLFKSIGFFPKDNYKSVLHKWKFITRVW